MVVENSLWIFAIGGIVLIIVLGIIVLLKKNKKNKKEEIIEDYPAESNWALHNNQT